MKVLAFAFVAGGLIACQGKSDQATRQQPAPQPGSPQVKACSSALGSFDRVVDVGAGSDITATLERVKEAVLQRCLDDLWSERALACMRGATTSHDTFRCWNDELTPAQREAATQALGTLAR